MVKKLLPASVSLVGQVNVNDRVILGLDGFLDEFHMGLCGGAATFFDIAPQTCTDDVLPSGSSAQSAGNHMIQRQFGTGKTFTAILAVIVIASEQIAAVEFDRFVGDTVISQQPNHTRHRNMKIDR